MSESNPKPSPTSDLSPSSPPPYLEVKCTSTEKTRRFAPGTKAGFALTLINNKLTDAAADAAPPALYIEAVKEGEEPISFGPSSILLSYGPGWTLHTVLDHTPQVTKKREGAQASNKSAMNRQISEPAISFLYIGKILLVFLFIFLLGGIFTLALENLPRLLLFINKSL